MLYPRENRRNKVLYYACRNCDYQEAADNHCVYRNEVHHTAAERTQVLLDLIEDPTIPRTKAIKCANCGKSEVAYFQVLQVGISNIYCNLRREIVDLGVTVGEEDSRGEEASGAPNLIEDPNPKGKNISDKVGPHIQNKRLQ